MALSYSDILNNVSKATGGKSKATAKNTKLTFGNIQSNVGKYTSDTGVSGWQKDAIDDYTARIGDYDWRSEYSYDPFDEEDRQRQLAGKIPKALEKAYDPEDSVDRYLYANGLPPRSKIAQYANEADQKALVAEQSGDVDRWLANFGKDGTTAALRNENQTLPEPAEEGSWFEKLMARGEDSREKWNEKVVDAYNAAKEKRAERKEQRADAISDFFVANAAAKEKQSGMERNALGQVYASPEQTAEREKEVEAEEQKRKLLADHYASFQGQEWFEPAAREGAQMELPAEVRTAGKQSMLDVTGNPYQNTAAILSGKNGLIDYMTPEERQTYDAIRARQGEEPAARYFDFLREDLESRWTGAEQERLTQYAEENPVDASILSTATTLPSAVRGTAYTAKQALTGEEINPTNSAFSASLAKGNIRGTVAKDMSPAGGFAYNAGMGLLDQVVNMATMGKMSSAIMGLDSYQSGVQNAKERGATDEQAIAQGAIAGIVESVTEKLGFDRLVGEFGTSSRRGMEQMIEAFLRNGMSEAGEETVSFLANSLADAIQMGDKAQIAMDVAAYKDAGMSDKEATMKAFGDFASDIAASFVIGGVLGAGTAFINGAPSGAETSVDAQAEPTSAEPEVAPTAENSDPYTRYEQIQGELDAMTEEEANSDYALRLLGEQAALENEINALDLDAASDPIAGGTQSTPAFDSTDFILNGSQYEENADWLRAAEESGVIAPGMAPRVEGRQAVPQSFDGGKTRVSKFARTLNESSIIRDENYEAYQQFVSDFGMSYKPKSLEQSIADGEKKFNKSDGDYRKAADNFESKAYDAQYGLDDAGKKHGLSALSDSDIANAAIILNKAQAEGDTETTNRIAAIVAAAATEHGRAINAYKLFKYMTPEGRWSVYEKLAQSTATRYSTDKQKLRITLSPETKAAFLAADAAFHTNENAETAAALEAVQNQITKEIASQIPATLLDKVDTIRYLAMLGNPKTMLRNFAGNVAMREVGKVKNGLSAALQAAFVKEENRTKTLKSRNSAEGQAAIAFAKEDAEQQVAKIMGGSTRMTNQSAIDRQRDMFSNNNPLGKGINYASRKVSDILENTDAMFLGKAYVDALSNYMLARNLKPEDMTGMTLKAAQDYASTEAKKATFRDDSRLADTISAAERKNKGVRVALGGVLPFKKTPINVAKRAIEYSPVGLLKTAYVAIKDKHNGEFSGAKIADELASNVTGSLLTGLGFLLAKGGWLTGGGSDNEDRNYYDESLGEQNYAINIPGVGSYTVDWFTPASVPLFLGAEVWNILEKNGGSQDESKINQIVTSLVNITDPIVEMSFLSGLNDTFESLRSNDYGGALGSLAFNAATGYVSQMVPTVFGQIARTIDPYRRDASYTEATGFEGQLEKAWQKTVAKIPFASQRLPEYIGNNGEAERNFDPSKPGSVFWNAFEQFVSPGYFQPFTAEPIDKERQRLHDATKASVVLPDYVDGKITFNGADYRMTDEERNAYKTTYGQIQTQLGNELVQSAAYQNLPADINKAELLSDLRDYAKNQALIDFLNSRGIAVDYDDKNLTKGLRAAAIAHAAATQYGIPLGDYFAIKRAYGDFETVKDPITGSAIDNSRWDKAVRYMQALGMTERQIQFMKDNIK